MNKKLSGMLLATAVAGLVFTGKVIAHDAPATPAKGVKCDGGNACKGKGSCHSKDNSCKGANACKGKGWVETKDEADCTAAGGKVDKSGK